jgi:hypothetical protein
LAIATNQLAIHRFQLAVVLAIAVVFAVIGVEQNIFTGVSARLAVGAGWLLIAIVDVRLMLCSQTDFSSYGYSISLLKRTQPSTDCSMPVEMEDCLATADDHVRGSRRQLSAPDRRMVSVVATAVVELPG